MVQVELTGTGWLLYCAVSVCGPTFFGVKLATSPVTASPVSLTGTSPRGPLTVTVSSPPAEPSTLTEHDAVSPTGISSSKRRQVLFQSPAYIFCKQTK